MKFAVCVRHLIVTILLICVSCVANVTHSLKDHPLSHVRVWRCALVQWTVLLKMYRCDNLNDNIRYTQLSCYFQVHSCSHAKKMIILKVKFLATHITSEGNTSTENTAVSMMDLIVLNILRLCPRLFFLGDFRECLGVARSSRTASSIWLFSTISTRFKWYLS